MRSGGILGSFKAPDEEQPQVFRLSFVRSEDPPPTCPAYQRIRVALGHPPAGNARLSRLSERRSPEGSFLTGEFSRRKLKHL